MERPCPSICCASRSAPRCRAKTFKRIPPVPAAPWGPARPLPCRSPGPVGLFLRSIRCLWPPYPQRPDDSAVSGRSHVPHFSGSAGGRVQRLVIGMPVGDFRVIHLPPLAHARVHDPFPQGRKHRRQSHDRVPVGQLRGVRFGIVLQEREPPVGLVVMIGMALQIDQQPVGRLVRRIPAVARQNMLILAIAQIFSGQTVMFHVIGQFKLPDGDKSLKHEKGDARNAADGEGKQQEYGLQGPVLPERI